MLFRIMTEDKDAGAVEAQASKTFEAFTTYKARGFWRGVPEASLVVEVVGPPEWRRKVRRLAKWIKRHNAQEAVLVEELRNSSTLI